MRRVSIIAVTTAIAGLVAGSAAAVTPAKEPAPAAAVAAATAAAARDPIGGDIRCLLIATSMASSNDPQAQNTGGIATFYYLGRLEGRITDAALEDRMLVEIPKLGSVGQAEAERCAQGIRARNTAYQALGDRLEKRLGPPPGAGAAPAGPATPPPPKP